LDSAKSKAAPFYLPRELIRVRCNDGFGVEHLNFEKEVALECSYGLQVVCKRIESIKEPPEYQGQPVRSRIKLEMCEWERLLMKIFTGLLTVLLALLLVILIFCFRARAQNGRQVAKGTTVNAETEDLADIERNKGF